MADLITHTCVAVLAKAVSNRPHVAIFVAGTCAPDILGRVPAMALTTLRAHFHALPEWMIYVWNPLHMPSGILMSSFILAFLFPAAIRRAAFWNLLGGGLLHMAVDLLQYHFGVGYMLLFPFSLWDFELGWIGSETTVLIVPVLLPLTVAIGWWRWGPARGRPDPQAGGT